jgi:nucleoside 2-deoxyribosyltransferase
VIGLAEAQAEATVNRIQKVAEQMLLPELVEVQREELRGRPIVRATVHKAPDHMRPIVTAGGQAFGRDDLAHTTTIDLVSPATRSRVSNRGTPVTAFVAMSFRSEEEPALVDYGEAMRRAAVSTGFNIDLHRMDLLEGDYEISAELMTQIDGSDIVIADFTLNSTNVYFELGYARGQGKVVIQTARKDTTLAFDIRNWRTIFYTNATQLEALLVPELIAACQKIQERRSNSG